MDRATAVSKEFGRRIRRRRMALGMIQKDLATKLAVPQGHVSRLEKGEFNFVHIEKLIAVADALATTIDFLLGRTDQDEGLPRARRKRPSKARDEDDEEAA